MVPGKSRGEQVHLLACAATPPDLQEPGVNIYAMVGTSISVSCSIFENTCSANIYIYIIIIYIYIHLPGVFWSWARWMGSYGAWSMKPQLGLGNASSTQLYFMLT